MKSCLLLLSLSFLLRYYGFSQSLPIPAEMKVAYSKGTRSLNGKPGVNYWQNQGDYDIHVAFSPLTNLLQGEETISYYNISPDTLSELIIRLYPDLYKRGIERLTNIAEEDLTNGVAIESLKIAGEMFDLTDTTKALHKGTNLVVKPGSLILPHSKTNISVSWNYPVNTGSQQRTGRVDSTSYFIAYFFPRVAVYDDIDGWDSWSYNGTQEFYNDFGNFNIEISVPKNFVVWATGTNTNMEENLGERVLKKFKNASTSADIIHVIDSPIMLNTMSSPTVQLEYGNLQRSMSPTLPLA